jgi:hypothetical protein
MKRRTGNFAMSKLNYFRRCATPEPETVEPAIVAVKAQVCFFKLLKNEKIKQ